MVTIQMLKDYRKRLVSIAPRLYWHRINLSDGGSVEVCSPLFLKLEVPKKTGSGSSNSSTMLPDWALDCFVKDEPIPQHIWIYVPVTKDETWAIGKKIGAYPLTTAVADQAHLYNKTHSITYAPWVGNKLQVTN